MRVAVLACFAALAAACSPAVAAQPPEAVRKPVEALYAERMQEMVDPEQPDAFRIAVPPGMYSRVDVNRDGVADWRVDFQRAQNPSLFCGTGGCLNQLYVSRPGGGYALALSRTVGGLRLGKANGERIIDIDFHGSVCGGAGADECQRRYVWAESLGRFLERPNKNGDGWLEDGPSPLVETATETAPAEVRAQLDRRVAICKAAGGAYHIDESPFNDLPDLNDDGVRDWVAGTSYDSCDMTEAAEGAQSPGLPVTVLVSKEGGFVTAWEAEGRMWGVQLLPEPTLTTLEGADDCRFRRGEGACNRVPWRWDGAKFVRAP